MNRGSGSSRGSGRGRGRGRGRGGYTWRAKATDSSTPDNLTPVRADVSSSGGVSCSSGEKSHSSWQGVPNNSRGGIHRNVTPLGHQRGGSSKFGSGSSSQGSTAGHSSTSFEARNSSDIRHDGQFGLKSGQLNSGEEDFNNQSSDTVKAWSKGANDRSSINLDRSFMESLDHPSGASPLSGESQPGHSSSEAKIPESTENLQDNENSECSIQKFDLFLSRNSSLITLKPSLMSKNKEKRKEKERSIGGPKGVILRPGMVLLKGYLSSSEQGNILNICRRHALDTVGFYQPSFGEGGKMQLKLMCFGEFWNPETNQYGDVRPMDGSKPPPVPQEFLQLVDRAIKDSQSLILSEHPKVKNVETVLPSVKPDICLVNFYSRTGRLGLHQDKDESRESLNKGIPIVSFSIGDSAEFLYSDQCNAESADKVTLESGDVLIFGGKSRHIFHGVPAILPNTAPKLLLDETNFRPGRLNLTFRQLY